MIRVHGSSSHALAHGADGRTELWTTRQKEVDLQHGPVRILVKDGRRLARPEVIRVGETVRKNL